ncbi:hypothetical protein D3C76_1353140 [compost metagenome]
MHPFCAARRHHRTIKPFFIGALRQDQAGVHITARIPVNAAQAEERIFYRGIFQPHVKAVVRRQAGVITIVHIAQALLINGAGAAVFQAGPFIRTGHARIQHPGRRNEKVVVGVVFNEHELHGRGVWPVGNGNRRTQRQGHPQHKQQRNFSLH